MYQQKKNINKNLILNLFWSVFVDTNKFTPPENPQKKATPLLEI